MKIPRYAVQIFLCYCYRRAKPKPVRVCVRACTTQHERHNINTRNVNCTVLYTWYGLRHGYAIITERTAVWRPRQTWRGSLLSCSNQEWLYSPGPTVQAQVQKQQHCTTKWQEWSISLLWSSVCVPRIRGCARVFGVLQLHHLSKKRNDGDCMGWWKKQ